jgi:hypothetical protein
LAYLVPNPKELLQGYAEIKGVVWWAAAINCGYAALPTVLHATPRPVVGGELVGLAYLVPNPETDQG